MKKHVAVACAWMALLLLSGCVRLTGQRFTWFHDRLADTVYLLIQYDGIHESNGQSAKGKDQIPKFIADGDIMLLDWIGHLQRERLTAPSEDPLKVRAAGLFGRIQVECLGHYREPDGRIGAAQLVTIKKFQAFLREVNSLISAGLRQVKQDAAIAQARQEKAPWRSLQKIFDAARGPHVWLEAHGHSLRIQVPVHLDEWTHYKPAGLLQLVARLIEMQQGGEARRVELIRALAAFASASVSYAESGAIVTVGIGNPELPRTLHVHLRDDYNEQLESVVVANAKTDLDRWLRRVVLPPVDGEVVEGGQSEGEQPGARGRREIRRWQAPEVEVAALLAGTAEPAERQRCIERLRVIGKRWDEDGGVPPAPVESSDETYLAGWRTWYQGRRHLGKR